MSYTALQRNQPSLQVLHYSESRNCILIQKIYILDNVCKQLQMDWQKKYDRSQINWEILYHYSQKKWQTKFTEQKDAISSLQTELQSARDKSKFVQKQYIDSETKHQKDKTSLESKINQYIEINKNQKKHIDELKHKFGGKNAKIMELKQKVSNLQTEMIEITNANVQRKQCICNASSSTIKVHCKSGNDIQNGSYSNLSHSNEQTNSIEVLSPVIIKTNSISKLSIHIPVITPCTDYNSNHLAKLDQLPTYMNSMKRSVSHDRASSISGFCHGKDFNKTPIHKVPKIKNSKTDICEDVELNQ
eukprot:452798_1